MYIDEKFKTTKDVVEENQKTMNEITSNDKQSEMDSNLIEEMYELEKYLNNPQAQKFTKSTYWNKLSNQQENEIYEEFFREILKYLESIEKSLTKIENSLTK